MSRFRATVTGWGVRYASAISSKAHNKMTLLPPIEKILNNQIMIEAEASQLYLGWASWAEKKGLPGISAFFYEHSEEERQHLIKMVKYVNKRGGTAVIPGTETQTPKFQSINELFDAFLVEEEKVTHHINEVIHECIENRDYITHDFVQWFANEQIQEEELCKEIIDRLKLLGNDGSSGMYVFDRDLVSLRRK
jgi:ferritin